MQSVIASPDLLNNHFKLVPFLSGDHEIDAMRKDANTPIKPALFFSQLHVFWIITKNTFESISSLFFKVISWLMEAAYFKKTGRYFSVLSSQFERDWYQLCMQWKYLDKLLTPAFNAHQMRSWDIFSSGEYPLKKIKDEEVRKATFKETHLKEGVSQAMNAFYATLQKDVSPEEKQRTESSFLERYRKSPIDTIKGLKETYSSEARVDSAIGNLHKVLIQMDSFIKTNDHSVKLFSSLGLCRGASLWFIKLFLQSETLSSDIEKRLQLVANEFQTGVPSQGAFLNGLSDSQHLLKVKKEAIPNPITPWDLDHDPENALAKIHRLENGIYRVGVYHHSFVFVKISESKGYVWNPNIGLLRMNGAEMLSMVYEYHYKKADPESQIYFEKYSKATKGVV